MVSGLYNVPDTYARAMNVVLHGLNWNDVLSFLDGLMALGKTSANIFRSRETYLRGSECISLN